jgi:hypothetical protein
MHRSFIGQLSLLFLLGSIHLVQPARAQTRSETEGAEVVLDAAAVLNDRSIVRGKLLEESADYIRIQERNTDVVRTIARANIRSLSRGVRIAPPPPTASPSIPPPQPAPEWYGEQLVVMDLAAVAAGLLGIAGTRNGQSIGVAFLLLGGATYLIGPPIVHGVNGSGPGTILGSFGLRLGAPLLVTAVAFFLIPSNTNTDSAFFNALAVATTVGFLVGGGSAMLIDDALLARRPASDATPRVVLLDTSMPRGSAKALGLRMAF